MKLKLKRVLLLALFLFFLPFSVFATSSDNEIQVPQEKDSLVLEEKVEEKKESVEEPQASNLVSVEDEENSRGGGTVTETVDPLQTPKENPQEEQETEATDATVEETVNKEATDATAEEAVNKEATDVTAEEAVTEEEKSKEPVASDELIPAAKEAENPLDKTEDASVNDMNKPEIGDPTISDPVGGGSSGGSGSGYVSSEIIGPKGIEFRILKVNEKGEPMQVAFKITNTITGESHILVTDDKGITNKLIIPPLAKDVKITDKPFTTEKINLSQEELAKLVEELEKTGEVVDIKDLPNIFGDVELPPFSPSPNPGGNKPKGDVDVSLPKVDNDVPDVDIHGPDVDVPLPKVPEPTKPEGPQPMTPPVVNENDHFLNKGEVTNLSNYDQLNKNDETHFFILNRGEGSLKIEIQYFDKEGSSIVHTDTLDYGTLPPEKFNQINPEKLIDFTKSRLAYLVKTGVLQADNLSGFSFKIAQKAIQAVDDIYKVEELRTDTNIGYSLKTFYIKRDQDGNFTMGDSLDKMDKKPYKMDFGGTTSQPCPPDGPCLPPPPPEDGKNPVMPKSTLGISEGSIPSPLRGGSGGSSGGGSYFGPSVPTCQSIPTFIVVNEKFDFHTYASHPEESYSKIVTRGEKTKVIDKITFDKLSQGKEYKFVGKLIHKQTGKEVETTNPIVYETGKLKEAKGETTITITFDSSQYAVGDEFVLVYDIYEDGKLAGFEKDLTNMAQSFKISDGTTPPPKEETPPPEEETPPPKEETPPPKEETPPPKEETPPEEETPTPKKETPSPKEDTPTLVEKEKTLPVKTTVKPVKTIAASPAPKTYDPGIGFSLMSAILSGAALSFLRKRR